MLFLFGMQYLQVAMMSYMFYFYSYPCLNYIVEKHITLIQAINSNNLFHLAFFDKQANLNAFGKN